jgi:hypothetical protein
VVSFLAAPMINNAKSLFLAVNASLHWINNIVVVYLLQVSSLLIGPCFPLAGGLCKFYANAGGTQPIQRQLLLVQDKQQATHIYQYTILLHL